MTDGVVDGAGGRCTGGFGRGQRDLGWLGGGGDDSERLILYHVMLASCDNDSEALKQGKTHHDDGC